MSGKRSTEQVHEEDGHPTPVASCARCASEAEQDRNAEQARAELVEESLTNLASGGVISSGQVYIVGEEGPEEIDIDGGQIVPNPATIWQCVEDGCTNKRTHRDGRCCDCHRQPR